MTTNNPETRSLEELAGVPNAAELEQLANAYFPDLTDSAYAATPAAPEAQNASAAQGVSAAQGAAAISQTPAFDWEHPFATYGDQPTSSAPFAYGGSSTDTWLNTVEAPAVPESQFASQLSDIPTAPAPAQGYSPKVVSKTQAAEASRQIDAPTSLGGDSVKTGSANSGSNSRNESIRIGSKTLAQIRSDFPILSKQINGHPLVWLDNGATTQRPQVVIDRLKYYYENENSNVHRGAHTLAAASTDAYENARNIVRDFIGAPSSQEVVFVRGTTEAINLREADAPAG